MCDTRMMHTLTRAMNATLAAAASAAYGWYTDAFGAIAVRYQLDKFQWIVLAVAAMPLILSVHVVLVTLVSITRFAYTGVQCTAVAGVLVGTVAVSLQFLEERGFVKPVKRIHAVLEDAWCVGGLALIILVARTLHGVLRGGGGGSTHRARGAVMLTMPPSDLDGVD